MFVRITPSGTLPQDCVSPGLAAVNGAEKENVGMWRMYPRTEHFGWSTNNRCSSAKSEETDGTQSQIWFPPEKGMSD